MSGLVEFLRARLNEDEAAAEQTLSLKLRAGRFRGKTIPHWKITGSGYGLIDEDGGTVRAQNIFPAEAAHVVRHDPARVLREIDAKRKILNAYEKWQTRADAGEELSQFERGTLAGLYSVCRTLAEAEGWKP